MNWDGLLLVNKPAGFTSHSVVQMVKARLHVTKAGHLGTLDPLATGVFPVCLGKATRLTPFYMKADKCYLTAVRFGFFTTTDDREGEQEGPFRKPKFGEEQLKKAVQSFQGDFDQRPPIYSAKKVRGQPAHRLARKGMKPSLPIQKVTIHEITLATHDDDVATVFIHCSSGTYVRSIARELGIRLRTGAHVAELTRTKFGQFSLDQTCAPDDTDNKLLQCFVPMEKMLPQYPEMILEPEQVKKIATGSAISIDSQPTEDWVRMFNEKRSLIAFARVDLTGDSLRLQPKIVFS